MEGIACKFPEENFQAEDKFAEESLLDEDSKQGDINEKIPKKSEQELTREEETLKIHLEKLKKENFTLQASIKAWQTTLKNKLDEFKQADLKLDEIHNEIWSEREKFCSKADKFSDEYGVLSDWWATQMKFVSDLENLEKKSSEDQKCRQEIEKLEKEVAELKKEINVLQGKKQVAEVEVHATQADADSSSVREEQQKGKVSAGKPKPKKIRFSDVEDRIEYHERIPTKDDLYSIVDLEKLRMANRNRKRLSKNHFFGKVKKLLTM